MDAEANQLCGGGANSRNGYREHSVATCVGTLTLRIPKLRTGSFFPDDTIERYQRVDRALVAAVAEMYATGTSTRKVQRIAEKMGAARISKDQVSAITSSLDADINELCGRPLDGAPVPYVWLDTTYARCRLRGAAWQRYCVHLMRDCMREAGSWQLRRQIGRILSPVFRGRDAATVTAMYHVACDMLEACCPRMARILEGAEPDALTCLDFPPSHWKRLRTNNVQERTNRETKRRSRVVQVFPSAKSLVRLAGAVMCEQDEIWLESRYFSEAKMNELYNERGPRDRGPRQLGATGNRR